MPMNEKRCVITGLGLVSAIGHNTEECFEAALKGVSGITDVKSFDTADCYSHKGAEVDLSNEELANGRYDRTTTGREDRQVREFGEFLKSRDIPVTLIDAGTGRKTAKRRAVQLAAVLHASYQPMEGLRIDLDSSPARET